MNKDEYLTFLDNQRARLLNNIDLLTTYACDIVDAPNRQTNTDDIYNPTITKNKCLARVLELTDDIDRVLDSIITLANEFRN